MLFAGVGPRVEVETFLAGDGSPTEQSFWLTDETGTDVSIDWDVEQGDWSAVVMNADGSPGVSARVDVEIPAWPVRLAAWLVTGLGLATLAFGAGLMWLGWRRTPVTETAAV